MPHTSNDDKTSAPRREPQLPSKAAPALTHAAPIALFLDIDGTLLEIADHPDGVEVPQKLSDLLVSLHHALGGAVAFLSGRSLADIEKLFPDLGIPAAGLHGFETRFANEESAKRQQPQGLSEITSALQKLCDKNTELYLEDKGASVALHYRQCPDLGDEVARIAEQITIQHSDFTMIHGKMVVEIKPALYNKGTAIDEFMKQAPFAGRTPLFFGDDVTDEAGFEAVRNANGIATRIGCDRATLAQHCLPDVTSMHDWLEELLNTLPANGANAP